MPRVALPASVKPSNHGLTAHRHTAGADPSRPSNPFAALLDGAGDATATAPTQERRQPGSIARSAARSDGETRIEPSTPRSHKTSGSADRSERPDPQQATSPDGATADETAGAEPEAKTDLGDDEEAATIDVTEATLLAVAMDDTAGQSAPAGDTPAAPAAGLAIAAAVAAEPAQDAIAQATDLVASQGATIPEGATGAPAPGAVPADDKTAAKPTTGSPAGKRPQTPTTAPSTAAATGSAAAEGTESQGHDGDPAQPEGRTEHAHSGAARGREGEPPAPDRVSSQAPTETKPGDAAPTGKPPVDGLQLGSLQHPFDRHLTSAAAPTAAAATAATVTTAPVSVEGLAIEIAARAKAGGNRFEIRLDPPELGRIDVRLDVDRSGHVTSRLTVERAETLDILRRDAPELERALQQAGLKTSDNGLQFTLRDQAFAGRDDERAAPDAARLIVPDELDAVDTGQRGYGRLLRLGGGIDIRV